MKGKYEPEEGEVEREKAMKLQIGGDWWCLLHPAVFVVQGRSFIQ